MLERTPLASLAGPVTGVEASEYREILGQFCTGITVIAAVVDGRPVGFTCQSFSALSIDPPLVLVCPQRTSTSWPKIRSTGRFAVSVLAGDHEHVSAAFARSGTDKFAGIDWSRSPSGQPVIDGAIAWLDCRVLREHDGGDHTLVVGQVNSLDRGPSTLPLLYHRGQYVRPDTNVGGA